MDRVYLNELYDIYKGFLNEHECLVFEDYYSDDLSLSEIADNNDVSRTAIYNKLKVIEDKLNHYEDILKLYDKYNILKSCLEDKDIDIIKKKIDSILN